MQINKDYPCNSSNYSLRTKNKVEYIVIHYVGALGSARENARYYADNKNLKASAHFFVGHASEDGAVYQSVDPKYRAWHCGSETGIYYSPCRNENSIGIEMCCHKDKEGNWYFDEKTLANAAELTRELMKEYSIPIERVIRHYDVTHKNCPAPLVKNESAWAAFKERIGEEEMTQEERAKFNALVDAVSKLTEKVDKLTPFVYNYIDDNMPSWAKPTVVKLINKGYLSGDDGGLNLDENMLRMLVINDRAGLYD